MEKCIIDTNVPTKASYAAAEWKKEELELINSCIEFVREFIKNPDSKLVLDMDWEIVGEYRRNIRDTDLGKQFLRWLYSYMAGMDVVKDMVKIEHDGQNYAAFPKQKELEEFDLNDRKFIALALTHSERPPIVQAADGKWLGFEKVLVECGVHIEFLDEEYANSKYQKKILGKRR